MYAGLLWVLRAAGWLSAGWLASDFFNETMDAEQKGGRNFPEIVADRWSGWLIASLVLMVAAGALFFIFKMFNVKLTKK